MTLSLTTFLLPVVPPFVVGAQHAAPQLGAMYTVKRTDSVSRPEFSPHH
jgi:hypothetical protein